jgi:predicted Zn-dependent peptidase
MGLGYFEMLGDAGFFNEEGDKYRSVTAQDIQSAMNEFFTEDKMNILYYKAKEN